MKLNIEANFATADVRPVSDPWGWGITFHIARIGCDAYQEWSRERMKKTGLQKQLASAAAAQGLTNDPEIKREILLRAADKGELNLDALIDREGVARHLIRNIEGLTDADTGAAVKYTPEVGMHLLSRTDPVETGKDEAGNSSYTPVGELIRTFVLEQAANGEQYRSVFLEAAGKNSVPRSAGSSE